MKPLRRLLCPFFLLIALASRAQTNAGMPLFTEMLTHFFFSYTTPNTYSNYDFQKRPEGWCVQMFDGMTGRYGTLQLYWSRKERRYLSLDFEEQNHPDSASVAEAVADHLKHRVLSADEITRINRNFCFGYDGWEQDVIRILETTPLTSDSLLETLAAAYDSYAGGYLLPQGPWKLADGDPDRVVLPDTAAMPLARIRKFIGFEKKALEALYQIDLLNPRYQCAFHDIKAQLNMIRMAATTDLTWLGFDSLATPFIQAVAYPDSVLHRARQVLRRLPPNSVLIMDKDSMTFPVFYLQAKGERRDIIAIDNLLFIFKRTIGYLNQKYQGTLLSIQPAVYRDSAFQMALYQPDPKDTGEHRLDSFLATLYASPDARDLPHIDSSFGRLYRYFSCHPYILINETKASKFYPGRSVEHRISFDLSNTYMDGGDVLNLDIVNTNLYTRHIFFTHPAEHPIFAAFCASMGSGVYEFIPSKRSGAASPTP